MPPALARWQHGNVQHAGQRPLERAAVVAPPPLDAVEAKRCIKSECKPRKERTARFVRRNGVRRDVRNRSKIVAVLRQLAVIVEHANAARTDLFQDYLELMHVSRGQIHVSRGHVLRGRAIVGSHWGGPADLMSRLVPLGVLGFDRGSGEWDLQSGKHKVGVERM